MKNLGRIGEGIRIATDYYYYYYYLFFLIIFIIIIFLTLGVNDPEGGKIKLNKNENSIGRLPGRCRQKNSPATEQSWIALQQQKRALEQKAGFTVVSRQCRNPVLKSFIKREIRVYSKCAMSIVACITVYRVIVCPPETAKSTSDDANSLRH